MFKRDKLNEKQYRFVQEYIVDYNATQAAKRAGYSEKTAYSNGQRLLKHAEVQAAIKEIQDKATDKAIVDRNMVLAGLLKEAEFKGQGASHAARVSAWEKIGKTMGMFIDKTENNTNIQIEKELSNLLDELHNDEQ